jgi:hypothetical protein
MRIIHKSTLAIFLLAMMAVTALAQGPLQKKVNFSINVPYAVRMGNYLLPPGNYVLYQISQNDLNLFALYPQDMTNEPIAMIRTIRIDFAAGGYPEKTELLMEPDETSRRARPVLQGWTIPGTDGWEIIGVVEKRRGVLARLN